MSLRSPLRLLLAALALASAPAFLIGCGSEEPPDQKPVLTNTVAGSDGPASGAATSAPGPASGAAADAAAARGK